MWGRATGILVSAVALSACGSMRAELCTTVHTRVLEELRTTDRTPHFVSDPWACERHALRLRQLAEELRAMNIPDVALRRSLEDYRLEVERLAEAYSRLSAAYQAQPEFTLDEARQVHTPLRREVLNHAASLSAPRLQLQRACTNG
ncbi:hypothetical protein [Hyalangium minutum]|uniref:Lipoprotein n=1 Tax=Hyalangium minutum TaxID=394096 RepID=A0A085WL17_9BACT|nr:hypothetical protein [Hyalangium minutum]KFE68380.1 hypothetical protein DB31_7617 [Hyalangium minutum]